MTLFPEITTFDGVHFFLSNFFPSPIRRHGKLFPTVEHAYQAAKTADPDWAQRIQNARSAGVAKRLGRDAPMLKDWDSIKESVMLECLELKFADEFLKKSLLETGSALLIEGNSWHDPFWGACNCAKHQGKGKNALGNLLMQVRREISNG